MNTRASSDVTAHLILVEHVVGQVDDLLHLDDGADARDLHVGQHGEHQDGLHQQLSVLRLRDTVQNRLHVDGELDLSRRHLEGETFFLLKYSVRHLSTCFIPELL